ncbi:hypothetical protein RRG08_056063 [Elysia crispata]|uniref:Uncharacterized protein n=1 Tax=Elysia crispata TaxID=231223 RepID=A0AAE0ZBL4_9GAST|nr:hypothetical protein RRG08_056063 [Elysia crispata]
MLLICLATTFSISFLLTKLPLKRILLGLVILLSWLINQKAKSKSKRLVPFYGTDRTSHPQTLNVEDILYDDNFRGMKDHFLMCGRGRRPALPSLPLLNNRVLVQLFHLREQGSATWDEVKY